MAARHDAEAESRARCWNAACAVAVGTVGDGAGGSTTRTVSSSGRRSGHAEREREVFDAGTVRPAAECERVGLGFAQQPIEVVEREFHEMVPLETGQIGRERVNRVLGTSHASEPSPCYRVEVWADVTKSARSDPRPEGPPQRARRPQLAD